MSIVVEVIPASTNKMDKIRMETTADAELRSIVRLMKKGWPGHISNVSMNVREYNNNNNPSKIRAIRTQLPGRQETGLLCRGRREYQGTRA